MATEKEVILNITDDEDDREDRLGIYIKEIFALSKKSAEPKLTMANDSDKSSESDKWFTAEEDFSTNQSSSQATESDKLFTAKEDFSTSQNSSQATLKECITEMNTDDLEGMETDESLTQEEIEIPRIPSKVVEHINLISDDENELNEEINKKTFEPESTNSTCSKMSDSESNIRLKANKKSSIIFVDEDEDVPVRPRVKQKRPIVYEDTDEDSDVVIICKGDTAKGTAKNDSPRCNAPSKNKFLKSSSTTQAATNSTKKNWWENFGKPVPTNQRCAIENCTFAPHSHQKHDRNERFYSAYEERLMIAYLIHHDLIQYGKGLRIWTQFRSQGYLEHRPVESLNNHFKRYILKDIKNYKLSKDLEDKFLSIWFPNRKY